MPTYQREWEEFGGLKPNASRNLIRSRLGAVVGETNFKGCGGGMLLKTARRRGAVIPCLARSLQRYHGEDGCVGDMHCRA